MEIFLIGLEMALYLSLYDHIENVEIIITVVYLFANEISKA